MSDPVLDKLDRHDEIINYLQLEQAKTNARIVAMEERMDRNQSILVEQGARIESKVDATTAWMNQSQGGLRIGKWIAGITIAVLGMTATWLKFFKGGG